MKPHAQDHSRFAAVALAWALAGILWPADALATQGHAGIEGVWVHQFAHLFFLFSMMLLIYWLRQAGLVKAPGWRYIQYAALFFILWNVDTFLVHFLDEQIQAVRVDNLGDWQIRVVAAGGRTWLSAVYYLAKMDHLLCVPAMIFLMLGLRHMLKEVGPIEPRQREHSPSPAAGLASGLEINCHPYGKDSARPAAKKVQSGKGVR